MLAALPLGHSALAQNTAPVAARADDQANAPVADRVAALEQLLAPWEEIMKGLTLGGAIRLRTEYRDPASYSTANPGVSKDMTLMRTRFHMDFNVSEHLSTRVEFQDSRTWGDGGSLVSDSEQVDLNEGYITFKRMQDCGLLAALPEAWDLSLRAGRQRLPQLGDQRMISDLDWHNVGRAFDGVHLILDAPSFQADILHAQLLEDSTSTGSGADNELTGIYISSDCIERTHLDVYAFLLHLGDDSITGENAVMGDLEQYTYGVRADHKIGDFKGTFEYAMQSGDSSDDDIDAHGYAAEVTYRQPDDGPLPWHPSFTIGTTFATGDANGTDGDQETFTPIAPFGHAYQGHMDVFAWMNGRDTYFKVAMKPCAGASLHIDYHFFELDEEADAWYSAAGSMIRPGLATADNEIGSEIDLYVKYGNERMKIWTGWSHFMDGDFVSDTGGGSAGDFVFFQVEVFFGAKR